MNIRIITTKRPKKEKKKHPHNACFGQCMNLFKQFIQYGHLIHNDRIGPESLHVSADTHVYCSEKKQGVNIKY